MKKSVFASMLLSVCLLLTGCKGSENSVPLSESTLASSVRSAASSSSESAASSSSESTVSSSSKSTISSSSKSTISSSGESAISSSSESTVSSSSKSTISSSSKSTISSSSKSTASSSSKSTASSSSKSTISSSSKSTVSSSSQSSSKSSSTISSSETSSSSSAEVPKPQPPETAGGFKVNGTALYDANGNKFVMRGINHPHVWFTNELNTALDGIAKTGANCVRVVLADGQQWSRTSADDLKNVIAQCEKRRLIAVVELHDATGNDNVSALKTAAEYWIEMKEILNAHKSTVIVNIANEWHHENWGNPGAWAAGYKEVIPMLRNAGIENTLMVDCDGYGQFADSLFRNGYAKQIFAADTQSNTMFSIHMYDAAGRDERTVKGHIDNCFNAGICAVIGEFAADHGNRGDVAEQTILDYCTEKGMGYIGWSWKGNGDGLGSLDISNDWAGNNLSSWGETLVNGNNGIKQTSKTCTVFE